MRIVKEKQPLDEMAILVISSRCDGLPFRITVQSPDHRPTHAHIKDLATGKKDLCQFMNSKDTPRSPGDVKDYKQGISDEWRQIIFDWAKKNSADFPSIKNWEMLNIFWSKNEKW